MAVNPYFKDYTGEQRLLDDLTIETIKVMGRDFIYLPREFLKVDQIFGEDPKSYFNNGHIIEMYPRETLRFGGNRDVMTKFGITITDRLTLDVSITRFRQEITSKNPSINRPREGDLIYFPLSKSLFEINFVEDEEPFYQFGTLTTYTLTCEIFTYSHEEISTGFDEVDDVFESRTNYVDLLGITGSGFTTPIEYIAGETLYQSIGYTAAGATLNNSTATATLVEYTKNNAGKANKVYISNIEGTFTTGQTIKGSISGAEYLVTSISDTNINVTKDAAFNPSVAINNDAIAKEATTEIEFSADNPFSENC